MFYCVGELCYFCSVCMFCVENCDVFVGEDSDHLQYLLRNSEAHASEILEEM